MIASLIVFVVALLFVVAACWDLATMKIPNWVSLAIAGLFPIAAVATGVPWHVIAMHLAFGAAVLMGCFFLFNANILGGGDAKLIPAAAVWTGAFWFTPFAAVMAVAGGALALTLITARKFWAPAEGQPEFLNRLLEQSKGAPYGVAIAAGGLFAILQTPIGVEALLTLP